MQGLYHEHVCQITEEYGEPESPQPLAAAADQLTEGLQEQHQILPWAAPELDPPLAQPSAFQQFASVQSTATWSGLSESGTRACWSCHTIKSCWTGRHLAA